MCPSWTTRPSCGTYDHKQTSLRLSPSITLPLAALRRHLVYVLHFKVDAALRLLRDLCARQEEERASPAADDAIYTQAARGRAPPHAAAGPQQ